MSNNNKKSNTLRGLIKNDKISNLLREALDSPIGSTSRKRAKNVANIMRKTHMVDAMSILGIPDGMGGPGFSLNQQPQKTRYEEPKLAGQNRLVIFPSAPAPQKKPDGKGGPGMFDFFSSLKNMVPNPTQTSSPKSPTGGLPSFNVFGTQDQGGLNYTPYTPPSAQQPNYQPISGKSTYVPPPTITRPAAQAPAMSQAGGGATAPTIDQINGGTTSQKSTGDGLVVEPQKTETPTGLGDKFSNLRGMAESAVKEKTGATMFAYQNVGRLSEKINTIDDTLRKQHDLDNLLNQKNNLVTRGITLEGDLTDYIRGRDEYLNQTQDMIDGFSDQMMTMDMGNPNVAKQADNYINYLFTLRGRQNKRYIEFLNSGINQYNAELTDISSSYDKALAAYQHELTQKSAVSQEEYTMYYNALSEMYNTIDQAPVKKLEMEKLLSEIYYNNARAVSDGIKANKVGSGLADDVNKIKSLIWNTDKDSNTLLPTVKSISGMIDTFASDGSVDPYSVSWAIVRGMENSLKGDIETVMPKAQEYMNMIAEYKKQAADPVTASDAFQMGQTITQAMRGSIKESLSDPNRISIARNAVSSLTSPGWFSKVPSRDEFINDYKDQFPTQLLNSMYSIFDQFKKDGGDPKLLFSTAGGLKSTSDADLAEQIATSVAGMELGFLAQ